MLHELFVVDQPESLSTRNCERYIRKLWLQLVPMKGSTYVVCMYMGDCRILHKELAALEVQLFTL